MNSKTKRMVFVVFMITIFMLICVFAVYSVVHNRRAVAVAEKYLQDKYHMETTCTSVRYSWIDPGRYLVGFALAKNPEITFTVIVQTDMSILEESIADDKVSYYESADNYYTRYFEHLLEKDIQESVGEMLGEKVKIDIFKDAGGMYSFGIPKGLDDKKTLDEMLDIVNGKYWIYIDYPRSVFINFENSEFINGNLKFLGLLREKYAPEYICYRLYDGMEKNGLQ